MATLFAEVFEAVASSFPSGGVPDPVVVEPEQEEPDVPAVYRLHKRLDERKEKEGEELRAQLEELQERLKAEEEVVKRFSDYDLAAEAKKPDFDRSEATKLQSESLIAQEVARGISDEIAAVNKRLRDIHTNYSGFRARLNESVRILDDIRRATAIGIVQGKGKLKQDDNHTRRWLSQVLNIEERLYKLFPDESDWPVVTELFDTLTTYHVPSKTTEILYENIHKKDKHQFEKFAPDAEGEKA